MTVNNQINIPPSASQKKARDFDVRNSLMASLGSSVDDYAKSHNVPVSDTGKHKLLDDLLQEDSARAYDTFLDTEGKHTRRNNIAQEGFNWKTLMSDNTLLSYLRKIDIKLPTGQKDLPIEKVIIQGLSNHIAKIAKSLPEAEKDLRKDMESIVDNKTFNGSLIAFQQNVEDFFFRHTNISPELRKKIESFSISNEQLLDGLTEMGEISEEEKKIIMNDSYENRPPAMKKLANGLFLKQTVASYKETNDLAEDIPPSMESMMVMPTLNAFFPWFLDSQQKKLEDYLKFSDIYKRNYLDFGGLTPQEKQDMLTNIVEKHFVPLVEHHGSKIGVDTPTYTKFLHDVFDLKSKKLTIPTANGKPITLNFAKKDLDGTITCEDGILEDDKLPLEFELADGEMDQYTKEFIKTYLHLDPDKKPIIVKTDNIPGLLMAFAMQHTTQLSEKDKKEALSDTPIQGPPENITLASDKVGDAVDTLARLPDQENDATSAMTGLSAWKDIAGNVKFEKGTTIALQCCGSNMHDEIKGNGGYGMFTITEMIPDEKGNPIKFSAKLTGVEDTIGGWEGTEFNNLPFTEKIVNKIKEIGQNGDIYALPAQNDVKNFSDYVNITPGIYVGTDEAKKTLLSSLGVCHPKGTDLFKEEEKITHFGKEIGSKKENYNVITEWAMFDVKFGDDSVEIKDEGGSWSRKMSFPAFATFIVDKGLTGYTKKQYEENIHGPENIKAGKKYQVYMMSLHSLRGGAKKWRKKAVVEGFEKNREASMEEAQEWIFESGINKTLGKMPFFGEYFRQSEEHRQSTYSKRQEDIVQKGEPRMGRLGSDPIRGKDDFVHHHELKGPDRDHCYHKIRALFKKSKNGEELTDGDRKEALAGLMYVLEIVQSPYPRGIVDYAGTNAWAKIILSPAKYKIYRTAYDKIKQDYENGPTYSKQVRVNIDALATYEMRQLGEMMKDEDHRYLYGRESVSILQKFSSGLITDAARKKGFEMADKHRGFNTLRDQEIVKKYQKENRFSFAVGALNNAMKYVKKDKPSVYHKYVGSIMDMMLGGSLQWGTNMEDKKTLRDMCRKHGLTFSEYMLDDRQGGQNLAELLQIISMKIDPNNSFQKATGRTPKNLSVETWSDDMGRNSKGEIMNRHRVFGEKFLTWFTTSGVAPKVMEYLHMTNIDKPNNLITILEEGKKNKTLDGRQQGIIKRYVDEAIASDITNDTNNYKDDVNDELQLATVLGTHKKLITMDYWNYTDGTFSPSDKKEPAQRFRNALGNRVKMFADQKNVPRGSVGFVLKKYYSIFAEKYGGEPTWLPLILARVKALKAQGGDFEAKAHELLTAGISHMVRNAKGTQTMPAPLVGALEHFEDFFLAHIDKIDGEMIKEVMERPDTELDHKKVAAAQEAFKTALDPEAVRQVDEFATRLRLGQVQQAKLFPGVIASNATVNQTKNKTKKDLANNFDDEVAGTETIEEETPMTQEEENPHRDEALRLGLAENASKDEIENKKRELKHRAHDAGLAENASENEIEAAEEEQKEAKKKREASAKGGVEGGEGGGGEEKHHGGGHH